MDNQVLLEKIIEIAKHAGSRIKNERTFEVNEKGDVANIVTTMDVEIQNMVLSQLHELLPEADFYAEENDVRTMSDGYVWVVDPIDGTTNYAYDLKHSCISIALLHHQDGFIGVVYNPYLDECFYGMKGSGAFCNGKKIAVGKNDMHSTLMCIGTSPYAKRLADVTFEKIKQFFIQGRDIRRSGSAALDLCDFACGRFDGFYEHSLAPWDYAAASVLIKEAGGIITTVEPHKWGFDGSITIIAGNKNNIDDIIRIVK